MGQSTGGTGRRSGKGARRDKGHLRVVRDEDGLPMEMEMMVRGEDETPEHFWNEKEKEQAGGDANHYVMICGAGYATDEQWLQAIRTAIGYGREGWAITRAGERLTLGEALASAC